MILGETTKALKLNLVFGLQDDYTNGENNKMKLIFGVVEDNAKHARNVKAGHICAGYVLLFQESTRH